MGKVEIKLFYIIAVPSQYVTLAFLSSILPDVSEPVFPAVSGSLLNLY